MQNDQQTKNGIRGPKAMMGENPWNWEKFSPSTFLSLSLFLGADIKLDTLKFEMNAPNYGLSLNIPCFCLTRSLIIFDTLDTWAFPFRLLYETQDFIIVWIIHKSSSGLVPTFLLLSPFSTNPHPKERNKREKHEREESTILLTLALTGLYILI